MSEFERRTKEVLDASTGRLDGRVQSRLNQARHRALAELAVRERSPWARWFDLRSLVPVGAVAATAVLAVLLWSGRPATPEVSPALEDVEILADADALSLAQEGDPEFYEWALDEVAAAGGTDAAGGAVGS
jgi:hypothetical protein